MVYSVLNSEDIFSPVWILWTIRAKLMACGGSALSAGSTATTRRAASVPLGVWERKHRSIWLRVLPCSDREEWQPLHLATSTTLRRASTGDPSTEKYLTTFLAPYSVASSFVVPGIMVWPRRASMPIA